jgi:hypothetical protein
MGLMDWQPIETAPEETEILVFLEGFVYHSYKLGDFWGCHGCGESLDKPSHWMPLPPAPQEADTCA